MIEISKGMETRYEKQIKEFPNGCIMLEPRELSDFWGMENGSIMKSQKEYDIPLEDNFRKDVSVMCNLSQGIVEETDRKYILNMYRKGYTVEQIADIAEKSKEEVEAILKNQEPVLA